MKRSKKTPWSESASELYRPNGRRLSVKGLPTFAYRRWHVISVTDPYVRILDFLGRRPLSLSELKVGYVRRKIMIAPLFEQEQVATLLDTAALYNPFQIRTNVKTARAGSRD
jgi:hypothetical protein